MSSPPTEKTSSLNHDKIHDSIKETIEANIEEIKEKIEVQAKAIKTLLREALAHSRAAKGSPTHATTAATNLSPTRALSPTRLSTEDFHRMNDEMSEHSRVIGQYIIEMQKSSFIKENTSRDEH